MIHAERRLVIGEGCGTQLRGERVLIESLKRGRLVCVFRRIAQAGLILSLALCMLIACLWVRSHWSADFIGQRTRQPQRHWIIESWSGVVSHDGAVLVATATEQNTIQSYMVLQGGLPSSFKQFGRFADVPDFVRDETRTRTLLGLGGLRYMVGETWSGDITMRSQRWRLLRIPYWLLIIPTLAWPTVCAVAAGRRRIRHRRLAAGLCHACGYDTRASGERCSECGTPITPRDNPLSNACESE